MSAETSFSVILLYIFIYLYPVEILLPTHRSATTRQAQREHGRIEAKEPDYRVAKRLNERKGEKSVTMPDSG